MNELREKITATELRQAWVNRARQDILTVDVRVVAELLGATYLAVARRAAVECANERAALSGTYTDTRYLIKDGVL